MPTYEVTITITAPDRATATQALTTAGFTPIRVTEKRRTTAKAAEPTAPHPFARASAALDRPEGLDKLERQAYSRGYAKACLAHVRKYGIPRIENTRAAEWERHPAAHKAGMAALRKEQNHPSRAVIEHDLAA